MAFITETKPGGSLAITDGAGGSSFQQGIRNGNQLGRLNLNASSNLQMSKFLSVNMNPNQKQSKHCILEAFLNRGENLERLFAHDVYIDNTSTRSNNVPQMPDHAQGY